MIGGTVRSPVACSTGPDGFLDRLHERVVHDFKRLPYPITPEFFHVCRDGVSATTPEAYPWLGGEGRSEAA